MVLRKKFFKFICAFLVAVLLVIFPRWLWAAPDDYLPLFQDDSVIKITIEAPFATLIKNAPKSEEPVAGRLIFHEADIDAVFAVEVSPRGISRRDRAVCKFPPLRVNFKKEQVKETIFHGQNRIKLVTHCNKSSRYEPLYVTEYAIYRAYNSLTPFSLRVRMAEITYIDSDGKNDPFIKLGFFIEDIDDLAERNGYEELEVERLRNSELNPKMAVIYALFQYLIGNVDWSNIRGPAGDDCCHNTKLVIKPETVSSPGAIIPVPYDFDFSGMVSAPYALPPEELPIRNVRQRLYRGACLHNEELESAVALFNNNREAIENSFGQEPLLDQKKKTKTLDYISKFYETVNDPSKLDREILRKCLGR